MPTGNSQYFILKSINHENISRAVAEGIWATQRHNEAKLNAAFRSSDNVFLIFSVNMSGHFQVRPCSMDFCLHVVKQACDIAVTPDSDGPQP